MASEQLLQPGVSVIQEFRTVSPTIVTPTLVPCAIAPGFQVVPAMVLNATGNEVLNSQAIASVPAILVAGLPAPYAGMDTLELDVCINNGPTQSFTFSAPAGANLDAGQVVDQIEAQSPQGFGAYVVDVKGTYYVQLRTIATGDGQSLKVLSGSANAALGFADNYQAFGVTNYKQTGLRLEQLNFPDPRGIIDELVVDDTTIRAFVNTGKTLMEFLRTQTFLRNKRDTTYISLADISIPTTISGLQFSFQEGQQGSAKPCTFTSNPTTAVDVAAAMQTLLTAAGSQAKITAVGSKIQIESPAGYIKITPAMTAHSFLHFEDNDEAWTMTVADDGDGDATSPLIVVGQENFPAPAGSATMTGSAAIVTELAIHNKTFQVGLDGGPEQDLLIDAGPIYGTADIGTGIGPIYGTVGIGPVSPDTDLSTTLNTKEFHFSVDAVAKTTTFNIDALVPGTITLSDQIDEVVDQINATAGVTVCYRTSTGITPSATGLRIAFQVGGGVLATPGGAVVLTYRTSNSDDTEVFKALGFISYIAVPGTGQSVVQTVGLMDLSTKINTRTLSFVVNGTTKTVTFSIDTLSSHTLDSQIDEVIDQINVAAGTTVCYRTSTGVTPSPTGLRIAFQVGGQVVAAGGVVSLIYGGSVSDDAVFGAIGFSSYVDSPTELVVYQTISLTEILAMLNATMGAGFASNASSHLMLSSSNKGTESEVRIGRGSANTDLGFVDDAVANGNPFPPKSGDQVFADGVFIGIVSSVAPGGDQKRLKLDRELPLAATAQAVYIEAMNIPATLPSDRPTPDLVIDPSGAALIKMEVLRDTEGFPLNNVSGALVIAYNALRLDVSPQAKKPSLLTFSDISVLEDTLDPLDLSNPLGLMFYFMMTNAPGISVTGIGVSAVDANDPDGTPLAYEEAFGFLEAQEVYALAPASQNPLVHQSAMAHVLAMSDPDAGGERVVLINPKMPTEDLPTLVASGEGDTLAIAPSGYWFDTKVPSLAADLQANQINPTGTISADVGLYLQIATSAEHYNIAQISGARVLIRVAFAPGQNDDGFYSQDIPPFSEELIGVGFTVYVRGTPLVTTTGLPDYDRIAAAYQKLGQTYGNRRVVMTAPEKTASILDGVEMEIPGYYINAGIAGMVGQLPPQQGFTNYPITGFTRVLGSNNVFSRTQMNVGAAGGTYWVVQETAGAPLTTRMQVTTDLTSIETREFSITRIVDFVAKFMRIGLRNFIGRFNITQPFLDTLSTVVQGQLGFLREAGILVGGDLNNVVQDSSAPDSVLIDVTLDVPYPCNYLRLTLVI